jgi:hypothetical protein
VHYCWDGGTLRRENKPFLSEWLSCIKSNTCFLLDSQLGNEVQLLLLFDFVDLSDQRTITLVMGKTGFIVWP